MSTLHPQAQAVIDTLAGMNLVPPDRLSIEEARDQFTASRAPFLAPAQKVGMVVNRVIPGPGGKLPIRVYRPLHRRPDVRLPGLVYFHGGGWVFGDLDSHDPLCRELCNDAGCALISIDYRLAPENKFPAAVEDAVAAIRHVVEHADDLGVDPARIAAGGDSAGGTLATVAALSFRDQGGPELKLQVLIYPVTDLSMQTPSYARLGQGYILTAERMRYFRDAYLSGPRDMVDWRASPLKARDLSGLPPALVVAASHDPLVDEGKIFADRLATAGVPVTYTCYEGMVHGFLTMAGAIEAGHKAIGQIAEALKRAFRTPPGV